MQQKRTWLLAVLAWAASSAIFAHLHHPVVAIAAGLASLLSLIGLARTT